MNKPTSSGARDAAISVQSVAKSYRNNRRLTTVAMTPAGGTAFTHYLALLEQIVQGAKPR